MQTRWLSFDTAYKDKDDSDYTSCAVIETLGPRTTLLREIRLAKVQFYELEDMIQAMAYEYNHDGKLWGIIIEGKASGTSALQTLSQAAERWIAELLIPFPPGQQSKEERARQAAVWCKRGMVWLPLLRDQGRNLMFFQEGLALLVSHRVPAAQACMECPCLHGVSAKPECVYGWDRAATLTFFQQPLTLSACLLRFSFASLHGVSPL